MCIYLQLFLKVMTPFKSISITRVFSKGLDRFFHRITKVAGCGVELVSLPFTRKTHNTEVKNAHFSPSSTKRLILTRVQTWPTLTVEMPTVG